MGNIEEPKKVIPPLKKATSGNEIKHHQHAMYSKTEIGTAIHSSKLQCKVNFHKFGRIQQ